MTPLILIVGDDSKYLGVLRSQLECEHFRVLDGTDYEHATELARLHRPSLIILGPKLPLISREEACSRFRSAPETIAAGIIVLGQSGEEHERVIAFRSGADDCITVPFSSAELIARIRAVLRRVPRADLDILRCGSLVMNLAAYRVWRDGRIVQLGPTDFRLLRHLMENPGRVFTRSQLLNKVWGHQRSFYPRTVDVHVLRIRKALNRHDEPDLIRTVRSSGYALDLSACGRRKQEESHDS